MAGTTQYFGVTYPTSTDYVKDGAVAIEAVADGFDAAVAIPTYNTQTGTSYTFALLDAAKVTTSNNAAAVTFTVPPQASVVWTTGATLTVANYGAGSVTIAGGSGVTITNSGATVSQFGSASVIRTGSDAWTVIPFAGGAALLSDSAISGTTGSPTITTFTDGGKNYKAYAFTGSGTITFTKDGLVDVLCIGGGGGGGTMTGNTDRAGGGGAGGYMNTISTETSGQGQTLNSLYITSGAATVTIGAGGATFANGTFSLFDYFVTFGGGKGGGTASGNQQAASLGGSGGGGYGVTTAAGTGISFQGNTGGAGSGLGTNAGGGGGASAVGVAGATTVGGAGGAGLSSSINGTATNRAGGGGGSGSTSVGSGGLGGGGAGGTGIGVAGTVNTGSGGGGGGSLAAGGAGGSGIVIVRVLA